MAFLSAIFLLLLAAFSLIRSGDLLSSSECRRIRPTGPHRCNHKAECQASRLCDTRTYGLKLRVRRGDELVAFDHSCSGNIMCGLVHIGLGHAIKSSLEFAHFPGQSANRKQALHCAIIELHNKVVDANRLNNDISHFWLERLKHSSHPIKTGYIDGYIATHQSKLDKIKTEICAKINFIKLGLPPMLR